MINLSKLPQMNFISISLKGMSGHLIRMWTKMLIFPRLTFVYTKNRQKLLSKGKKSINMRFTCFWHTNCAYEFSRQYCLNDVYADRSK